MRARLERARAFLDARACVCVLVRGVGGVYAVWRCIPFFVSVVQRGGVLAYFRLSLSLCRWVWFFVWFFVWF